MAASATVGILRVLLTMDTAEYEAASKRVAESAKGWSKDLGTIGRQASQIGQALTTSVTLPIVGVATAAIATGVKFESAMNAIQGVLQPTKAEMERVRATAIRLGADTAFSATDAATAMLELGKAGFTTAEAIESVPQVLELAAASGLSMGQSAELAARALNSFGLETTDLSHVNDVLAKAVNSSTLEITDLQTAFKYIGPIAKGFGVGIEEASAALAIMRDNGIAAETSGRALREGMSRLANPVKAVAEVASELGVSLGKLNPETNSFATIIQTLEARGLTAAQALRMFGDAAGPGMFALVNQGSAALVNLTDEFRKSDGAAKAMADAMMTGLPGAMERLKGSVETAWLAISKAIEPTVIRVMDGMGNLADVITTQLAPAFLGLPAPVQGAAIGLTAVAAGIGPVLWGLGQLVTATSAVVGAFGTAGIATKAFQATLSFFAVQLPTVTAGFTSLWSTLAVGSTTVTVLTGVLQGLGVMLGIAGAAFAGWQIGKWVGDLTGATDAVGKFSAKLGEMVGLLPEGTAAQYDASRAAAATAKAGADLSVIQQEVARETKRLGDAMGVTTPRVSAHGDAIEKTGKKAKDAGKELRDFYNFVGERQMEDAAAALAATDRAQAQLRQFYNWLGERQMEAAADARAVMEAVEASLRKGIGNMVPFKEAVKQHKDTATEVVGVWGETMAGLPNVIMSAIQGGGSVISAAGAHIGSSLMKGFVENYGPAIEAALPFGLGKAVTSLLPILGTLLGPIAKRVGDFFKNIFGGPSGDELAGRGLVKNFEDELDGVLTAQQRAEAGGEDWKETVIAIRDAYIAMGRTEEEALADAKRLWESSKQGAEASARVIEEIRRKMKELTDGTHTIDVEVNYREGGQEGSEGPRNTNMPVPDAAGFRGAGDRSMGVVPVSVSTVLDMASAASRPAFDTIAARMDSGSTSRVDLGDGSRVENNLVVAPVVMGANRSPYDIAREVVGHVVGSALPMNESGLTTAIERVIGNWMRTANA